VADDHPTLATYQQRYYAATGMVSTQVRALALAGLALIWLFRLGEGETGTIRPELRWPTLLLVATLAADLLHYIWRSIAWGYYQYALEQYEHTQEDPAYAPPRFVRSTLRWMKTRESGPYLAPPWINAVNNALFWGKTAIVSIAYGQMLVYFTRTIF